MELCTFQAISKLPSPHSHKLLVPNPTSDLHCSNPSLLALRRASPPLAASLRLRSRSPYSSNFLIRATSSEEASSGASGYGGEERETVATYDPPVENKDDSPVYGKSTEPEVTKEEPVYEKATEPEVAKEDLPVYSASVEVTEGQSSGDEQSSIFEYLDKFDIESVDKYSLALYGSGALFALWITSAVVGAIDSIPLFPKLMELVGLGYTVWFTYRYLIFKNTREELFAKFEELKEEVIGSDDD